MSFVFVLVIDFTSGNLFSFRSVFGFRFWFWFLILIVCFGFLVWFSLLDFTSVFQDLVFLVLVLGRVFEVKQSTMFSVISHSFLNQLRPNFAHYIIWYSLTIQITKNLTKLNQTSFPLNAKFSAICYQIFITFGMVICTALWHINMQNIWWLEYACVHSMHKHACTWTKLTL